MKTYLGTVTVFEPERYLRERNRKKRLLLREARPLEYEDGREIDADGHSDFRSDVPGRLRAGNGIPGAAGKGAG